MFPEVSAQLDLPGIYFWEFSPEPYLSATTGNYAYPHYASWAYRSSTGATQNQFMSVLRHPDPLPTGAMYGMTPTSYIARDAVQARSIPIFVNPAEPTLYLEFACRDVGLSWGIMDIGYALLD
jgi:hypothetical protein